MRVTKKIFTRAATKKKLFNWIFYMKFTLKNYSNSTFLCWKTKSPNFYCLNGKKICTNEFASRILFVCVCVFWNKKYIFSNTFDLCGWVGDKKFSRGRFPEKRKLFFLALQKKHVSLCIRFNLQSSHSVRKKQ